MCKGNKKCKACALASIGKTMAKKSRKSTKSAVMDVALYGAGVAAGGILVPKAVEQLDPTGKLDDKIVNALTAAVGIFGAQYATKAMGQEAGKVVMGIGIGGAAALLSDLAGMNGMGYVVSPSYDVNRILGDNYSGTTGLNPGDL